MGALLNVINPSAGTPTKDITYDEALDKSGETIAWFLKAKNRASEMKAHKKLGWQPKDTPLLEDIESGSYAIKK